MHHTNFADSLVLVTALSGCSLISNYNMGDFSESTAGGNAGKSARAGSGSKGYGGSPSAGAATDGGVAGAVRLVSSGNIDSTVGIAGSIGTIAGSWAGRGSLSTGGTAGIVAGTLVAGALGGGFAGSVGATIAGNVGVAGSVSSGGMGRISTAGAASDGSSSIAGAAGLACPGSGGPPMVRLPLGYCIDSTEVTREHYYDWLSTNPTLSRQDSAMCSWNTTFLPDATCMSGACQGAACGSHPQVCIDWCDASAYCKGVGKQLCGDFNYLGGQWRLACSSGAQNTFPYGNTFDPKRCNGRDYWEGATGTTLAVGSLRECQATGAYAGVFDLSGNVWEWEDGCTTIGDRMSCPIGGGSYARVGSDDFACSPTRAIHNMWFADVGFRCCAP